MKITTSGKSSRNKYIGPKIGEKNKPTPKVERNIEAEMKAQKEALQLRLAAIAARKRWLEEHEDE